MSVRHTLHVRDQMLEAHEMIDRMYTTTVDSYSTATLATLINNNFTVTEINNSTLLKVLLQQRPTCPDRHVFRIGDRIMTRYQVDRQIKAGAKGTIVAAPHDYFGVCFDENVGGHDGLRDYMTVVNGHGWYLYAQHMKYLGWRVNPATVPANLEGRVARRAV